MRLLFYTPHAGAPTFGFWLRSNDGRPQNNNLSSYMITYSSRLPRLGVVGLHRLLLVSQPVQRQLSANFSCI
jgi:hypothetical protein